jgi:tetratricopeptide (TPR) repeat protein
MSNSKEDRIPEIPSCPVCGSPRFDLSLSRCDNCGSDLSSVKVIEDFTASLLYEARNDIRNRKYTEARTKLEIASWMDQPTADISNIIASEILENEHRYFEALDNYEEARRKKIPMDKWGINLDEKIARLKEMCEMERAAKEHFNLALHRSREGFFTEAREELYKAADLAPYLPEIYHLAAKVDLALGAETALYDDITRFRQLKPGDPRGEQMMKELENRKHMSRIQMDQVFFAVSLIVFTVAVLVIIVLVK